MRELLVGIRRLCLERVWETIGWRTASRLGVFGIAIGAMLFAGDATQAQIVEYQRPMFRQIGWAGIDNAGRRYVAINPRRCRRMGPELCNFFRNHEYAHHQLGHFHRNISVQQAEAEADRWAAMRSSPASVQAAQRFFARGLGGSRLHGTSQQRLYRISAASGRYYVRR